MVYWYALNLYLGGAQFEFWAVTQTILRCFVVLLNPSK